MWKLFTFCCSLQVLAFQLLTLEAFEACWLNFVDIKVASGAVHCVAIETS